MIVFLEYCDFVGCIKVQFLCFLALQGKAVSNSRSDVPKRSSKLVSPAVKQIFTGKNAIPGFCTPRFFWTCPVDHSGLWPYISTEYGANLLSRSAEQVIVRTSSQESSLISLNSARWPKALIAYQASSLRSVVCGSLGTIGRDSVVNIKELSRVFDMLAFGHLIGLVQTYSTVVHLIYHCCTIQMCRWLDGFLHQSFWNGQ